MARLLTPLVLLLALGASAEPVRGDDRPAEATYFTWKFALEEPFYQRTTTTIDQKIKIQGQNLDLQQNQTMYFKWTPVKQDGDLWQFRMEIEGVRVKVDTAGNVISFDSTVKDPDNGAGNQALAPVFKVLHGASFVLTVNLKTMQVEKVEGGAELIEKLTEVNKNLKPQLVRMLSDEALKQMAEPLFGFVPTGAKSVGDKWEATAKIDLGPIGSYKNQSGYVHKGREKTAPDIVRLEATPKLTYSPPTKRDPALPFAVTDGKLTTTEGTKPGTILFNTKTGRLERLETALAMSGTLTVELSGQAHTMELDQTQHMLVEVSAGSFLPRRAKKP